MGNYDAYEVYLRIKGGSPRDRQVDITKRTILSGFKASPSYYNVSVYTPSTPLSSTPSDVWITDDSELKSQKVVTAIPGQSVDAGYLYYWNNEYWLTIQNDYQLGGIYDRGVILRCYSSIKWLDENGDIRSSWFCMQSNSTSSFGIEDGRVLILPNERRELTIQDTIYTRKIEKNKRFIVDGRAWRVIGVNRLIDGIITLTLEENLINKDLDNVELGIADYYNNVSDYSVTILNGENVTISTDQTLQLNVQAKNNDRIIESPVLVYSIDFEDVATVSTTGLVTPLRSGIVIIDVGFKGQTASIQINITDVVTHNYTCEIVGKDEITVGKTQSYVINFYDNGVEYTDESVISLKADDGVSVTNLASISAQNSVANTFTVLAGSKTGYVKLIAGDVDGKSSFVKRVWIKPLY
ncbi:hypothetical protein [Paenibacillus tianjinensis]|uniref:Ig-like domain (Group 2) n=1 Tax=Paenibacillus tianjinensis TaxID=2810347 RepID=A0ABX7L5Y9_9BACL|nr:hypothetical protein [Paenibacillus tianjinensis]QSF43535.1 hypothetical protein JRJ22_19940 [Paenibacillus tianjinensis]